MFPHPPFRLARFLGAFVCLALVCPATPAHAVVDGEVSVSPWVGTLYLDADLGDFRWNTSAQTVWGASAHVRKGRLAAGARAWRGSTRQSVGTPSDPATVDVNLTGVDALGEARLMSLLGVRLVATGAVGALHIGWSPSSIELPGLGESVRVDFDPIREASFSTGLAVRRSLIGGFGVAVGAERSWFHLDTAHRRGNEIVNERTLFGTWTARIELSRSVLQL
ncbi:MAG: hypothetical protein DHS20C21_04410 [Gemmatimonadota bacterium]|nr:MAG: hypothetical protein DHS20C21_04410 [Gemmatimonadota bacterium]